jgi:hypothetical protein
MTFDYAAAAELFIPKKGGAWRPSTTQLSPLPNGD